MGVCVHCMMFHLEYPPSTPSELHGEVICVQLHDVSPGVPTQYAIRVTRGGHLCSVTWCFTWSTHPVRHQSYTGRSSVFSYMMFHLEYPPSTPSELHGEVICVQLHDVSPGVPTQYAIRVTRGGHLCSVTWCFTWGTHPVRHQSYTGRSSVFSYMMFHLGYPPSKAQGVVCVHCMMFHLEDPPSTPSELHREVIRVWLHGVPPTAPTQYAIRVTQGGDLCLVAWCSTWRTRPVKHRGLFVFHCMVGHLVDPPSKAFKLHGGGGGVYSVMSHLVYPLCDVPPGVPTVWCPTQSTQCVMSHPEYPLCDVPPGVPTVWCPTWSTRYVMSHLEYPLCDVPPGVPTVWCPTWSTHCVISHPEYPLCDVPPEYPLCDIPPGVPTVWCPTRSTHCVMSHLEYPLCDVPPRVPTVWCPTWSTHQ